MLDDQFIFSSSWLPIPRFELRTLAGYNTDKYISSMTQTPFPNFWFYNSINFVNSNPPVNSRIHWLISAEGQITYNFYIAMPIKLFVI